MSKQFGQKYLCPVPNHLFSVQLIDLLVHPLRWTDLFEKELSIAQTTELEFLLMGDFSIDMISCSNSKWLNLIQLFDLSQLVKHSTRVTETSSSIIDHAYTTESGKYY